MSTEHSASRNLPDTAWRTGLQWISLAVAIEVALHAFIVKEPILTLMVAGLWFGAGFVWTRRGGKGGPVAIGILALFEIGVSLFFSEELAAEEDIATWIIVVHLVMVTAVLLFAIMTLTRDGQSLNHEARTSGG